jgi:hypothetical protein
MFPAYSRRDGVGGVKLFVLSFENVAKGVALN